MSVRIPISLESRAGLVLAVALAAGAVDAGAELEPEQGRTVTLPATPDPHWVWVNDFAFDYMQAGKVYLVDADRARVLGMLSTGFATTALALPRDHSMIYAPETYFSRGTRGERTDLITYYDPRTLSPVHEVEIPPKRAQSLATYGHTSLTDDDRFLLIYNFTPAQSVSVVDADRRRFVGEVDTPGCALAYPVGERRFFSMCADASLLTVTLDDAGESVDKRRSEPFFDPAGDYVNERPARYGDTWLFFSVGGNVLPADFSRDAPRFGEPWSLVDEDERAAGWRPGGILATVIHQASGRLYALMHKGEADTRKDPGREIWVYDIDARERVQRIELEQWATSIQVSQDDEPLLYTMFVEDSLLRVYDARTGEPLRQIGPLGMTPALLQTPHVK